jgi:hypothetical protein
VLALRQPAQGSGAQRKRRALHGTGSR